MSYKILTINPGSTSTKIALFQGGESVFSINVRHDAVQLEQYKEIADQFEYRKQTILTALNEACVDLVGLSAVVGRGGGLLASEGGVYAVDDILLDHARRGANGIQHPAQLGSLLAKDFADEYRCPAFVVNPPDTDELQDVARMTGVKGIYRNVHLHALNLKETAIRHAQRMSKHYEDCNYIVCHIGGGISVSAHCKGRMIDGNDIVGGEGPMAPTRCGALPASALIRYCLSAEDPKAVKSLCTRTGGFVSHLGTSDAIEVIGRATAGDKYAAMVWDAMIYQIIKEIGAMAAVLEGTTEGILLGGGMVHDKGLVDKITNACQWIAPVYAYPGEFEMEAMAAGAERALNGSEHIKQYVGVPIWSSFDFA